MTRVSVGEFLANSSRFLQQVAQGETVQLTKDDRAIAEVRGVSQATDQPRPIGLAKGTFDVPPAFFEPLPEELVRAFEGGDE